MVAFLASARNSPFRLTPPPRFIRHRRRFGCVPDLVVGDADAVVRRQLVLPVGVAIGVEDGLDDRPDRARGVGVLLFVQDVAAAVVLVHPRRVLGGVVDADELTHVVVGVGRRPAAARRGRDVADVIANIELSRYICCLPATLYQFDGNSLSPSININKGGGCRTFFLVRQPP